MPGSGRLPGTTRLGRVRLQVADLARSLAFYTNVLGLHASRHQDGAATLHPQDDDRPLVELRERRGAVAVPPRGRLGLYHFALLLPDRAALGRFIAHLTALGIRAGAADHLVSEALYLHDPDGLGIEVYADRPRATWRQRGTELLMGTDPLDPADLAAAAGGEAWSGMPAGTTVGHIHLHVADLRAAQAFYDEGLGFDVTVSSYPGVLFLSAGGYHHHLGVNVWAGTGASPPGRDDAQLLDWQILLPPEDLAAAARRVMAAGHAARESAGEWHTADPSGTTLRLTTDAG